MIAPRLAFFAGLALAAFVSRAAAEAPAVPGQETPAPGQPGIRMMAPIPDEPTDRPPPRRNKPARHLSEAERELYVRAMDAADRGDWPAALGLADQGRNVTARDLVEWRYLQDEKSGAPFARIDAFLAAHPDWPRRATLFARAEEAMPDGLGADTVIAWFGVREPSTGRGKLRLGEALIAKGRQQDGTDWIRRAWIEHPFQPGEEIDILRRHAAILTPEVHRARLERLLWNDNISAAKRAAARVDAQTRKLVEARIELKTNPRRADAVIQGLPAALRSDPGVLYDEVRGLRRRGRTQDIPAVLLRVPADAGAAVKPELWWEERHREAREAIDRKDYRLAYDLVARHGLVSGGAFADAEFLAGWLALRFLDKPAAALDHFARLREGVSYPISRARAHYWGGRAAESLKRLDLAWQQYRLAAQNPETFYGQLAVARLDAAPRLKLPQMPLDTSTARDAFERDDLTGVIRVLADLGQDDLVRSFATHMASRDSEPKRIALLAEMLTDLGYRNVAVRVAKVASYDDVLILPYTHPVIELPRYAGRGNAPETALVLGLIRQETEFDDRAVSGAGARGIMQLMPATARETAGQHGLTYRRDGLIEDVPYNIQLGMAHLSDLVNKWGGSYVLATAAYNAGNSNVARWIARYGDPRDGKVDPVDWIELIPYGETRNYVQRVLENTAIYRNRLSGNDEPLRILADLYGPNLPDMAPLPYVAPAPVPGEEVPVPRPSPRRGKAGTAESAPKPEAATGPRTGLPRVPSQGDKIGGERVSLPLLLAEQPDATEIPEDCRVFVIRADGATECRETRAGAAAQPEKAE